MIMGTSPADIVRQLLVQLGVGVGQPVSGPAPDWQVFATEEPSDPDQVITVYDTAGRDQGRSGVDQVRSEMYGIQVRVRSNTFASGWLRAKAVCDALDGVFSISVIVDGASYTIRQIMRTSGVLVIGYDTASRRRIFTVNALMSTSAG